MRGRWTAVLGLLAWAGSTARATDAAPPVQLKIELYARNGLKWRLHLRSSSGEASYSYIRKDGVWMGLFHDPAHAAQARAFAVEQCDKLAKDGRHTTLAEAELRAEDSAAFVQRLLHHETITTPFRKPSSAAKVSIACAEGAAAWKREVELDSADDVSARYGALLGEAARIGDAAVAAATAK